MLTIHYITPNKNEIFGRDDGLYIGTGGSKCELKSHEAKSNIENVSNLITGYTLMAFARSFKLNKPITCLKCEIIYHGKLYSTGDSSISKQGEKYTASPNVITWDLTKAVTK